MLNLDIDGFFTSAQFVTQLAFFITSILSAIAGQFITNWFGTPA
jgi:hypothetical protein